VKLVASLTSPFARKIRIMLLEKSIACELQVDIPWNSDTHVPDHNPLGKVPVLITDNGDAVYDSRVIAQYLDTLPAMPKLIPDDPVARIAVLRWEALADGISDAAALIFLERHRRTPAQQNEDWVTRQSLKIKQGLAEMERLLYGYSWCAGEKFSLADIAVGCALGYLTLRAPERTWRSQHPTLAALADTLAMRHSFQQTMPPT
jgi:glutathione S-transferase